MHRPVQRALVLGAGISGRGAARLLTAQGAAVTLADRLTPQALGLQDATLQQMVAQPWLGRDDWPPGEFDVAVVSPGIRVDSVWVEQARDRVPEVVSELEWGARHLQGKIMAVTGSNGKSTAVKWLAAALQAAGYRAVIAGNYGRSVCEAALHEPAADWWVLEVSSFQLETVHTFRPDAACLTNLFPNHLDRHPSFEVYAALKARLFGVMDHSAPALVPLEWLATMQLGGGAPAWQTFGTEPACNFRYKDQRVYYGADGCVDLREAAPALASPVAAGAVGLLCGVGVGPDAIGEAARCFEPLPHRLQPVGMIYGVQYINDSKATNLAALRYALERMDHPVHLIAGGLAKEEGLEKVKEVLEDRVKCVYCIGDVAKQMYSVWSPFVPCRLSGTLVMALEQASADAQRGEVVLCSPGCASFDQFRSYVERGERFTEWVRARAGRSTS